MFIKMMQDIREEVEIPEGVEVEIVGAVLKVKGPKGENERKFLYPKIEMKKEGNKVVIVSKKPTKREKKMSLTFRAHIRNMLRGVGEGFVYKVKICSSHFPMSVSVADGTVVIKNFFGEKAPRKARVTEGINVKAEGDILVVEGVDKEKTGQMAARIEQATRITNRCRRVFQDGCYIIEKDGKEIR